MSHKVLVVGAGPAGALLAYLLARGGISVTLLERHHDFSREFRGEGISPSGVAALREAGLLADFEALPATQLQSMALYSGQKPFLELELSRLMPRQSDLLRVMPQEHLLEMLVRKAADFPGFELIRGAVVQDAVLSDGRVCGLRFTDGSGQRELQADYVIAADSRFSILRKRLDLGFEGRTQVFDVVWCKVARPKAVPRGRVYSFLLDELFGLVFPTEHDHLQVGRIIPKGTYREFRGADEGDWYGRLVEMFPPEMRPAIESVRASASDPALLDVICGSMGRWSAPGVCFIGDAAHPMSPIGAQGLNVAMRDSVVAANYLGPLLLAGAGADELDRAAHGFEVERRVEVSRIQSLQTQAPLRLTAARRMAPILAAIPKSWIMALARFAIGRRPIRAMIEGNSSLRLTFGARG